MSKIMERGAREREPPPQRSSKISNAAANLMLTSTLLSSSRSNDLSRFNNKNIVKHRNNDIHSEKSEVKAEYKAFQAQDKIHLAVHEKIELLNERTEIIKSEYGSIANYNKAKLTEGFEKPTKLLEIESRTAMYDKEISKSSLKLHKYTDKAELINADRSENRSFRAGCNRYDKNVIKEANTRTRALKFEDARYVAVAEKQSLLSERSSIIKSEYGSIENYNKLKGVEGFEKPKSLLKIENRIAGYDTEIRTVSDKFKKHSASADKFRDKRMKKGIDGDNPLLSKDKFERKAAKADLKLLKSEKAITHRIVRKSYLLDEKKGKIKKKLIIEKEVKPLGGKSGIVTKGLKGLGAVTAVRLSASIHGQLTKHGSGTDSEKAFNTGVRAIEHGAVKTAKHAHKFLKERPYKKVTKLQLKADKANAKLYAKRKGGKARQMKKHAREYMKKAQQARKAQSRVSKIGAAFKKVGVVLKKMLLNPVVLKVLIVAALVVLIVSLVLGIFIAIGNDGMNIFGAFLAEDEEIYAADNYANTYTVDAVQNAINGVISSIAPDTVIINPYTLGHNPYALTAFLSALSFSESGDEYDNFFNANDSSIVAAIELFVNTMYYITYSTSSTTTTTWYVDGNGDWYSEQTTHITLTITVNQRTEDETVQIIFNSGSPYTPEMYELYQMYMETQGFRPDLFPAWAN